MKRFGLFIFIFLIFTSIGFSQVVPLYQLVTKPHEYDLQHFKERPDLSVNITDSAKLKIISRKTQYHLGEMMILDIALLNTGKEDVFYPWLTDVKIRVKNKKGLDLFNAYSIREGSPGYNLISPRDFDYQDYKLLVQCDYRTLKSWRHLWDSNGRIDIFEKNLFVTIGNGCIDVNKPDELTISAEITNGNVVVFESKYPKTKTPTGKITSNPLKIKIIR